MCSFIQWLCPEIVWNAVRSCENSKRVTTLENEIVVLRVQVQRLTNG